MALSLLLALLFARQGWADISAVPLVHERQITEGTNDDRGTVIFGEGVPNRTTTTPPINAVVRPSPSITTSLGSALDLTTLLSGIPHDQYATISSLFDCLNANGLYSATDKGTLRGTVVGLQQTIMSGSPVVSYKNEYTYTGCDGIPRVAFTGGSPESASYYLSPFTITVPPVTYSYMTLANDPCPGPDKPTTRYCGPLQTMFHEYDRIFQSYSRRGTLYTDVKKYVPYSLISDCGFPDSNPLVPFCKFDIEEAELFHWPEPAYEGISDNSTIYRNVSSCTDTRPGLTSHMPRETASFVIDGETFISPSVYVKYKSLRYTSSLKNLTTTWSKSYTYLPFRSEDVSSVCRLGGKTVPYDFRDLYGTIPWSAYACAMSCESLETRPVIATISQIFRSYTSNTCRAVDTFRNPHRPVLAWPAAFSEVMKSLDPHEPEYDCDFGFQNGGIYDPPHTLSKAQALTTPAPAPAPVVTEPAVATQDPPAPSPTLDSPVTRTKSPKYSTVQTEQPGSASYPAAQSPSSGPSADPAGAAGNVQQPQPSHTGVGSAMVSMINLPPLVTKSAPGQGQGSQQGDPSGRPAIPTLAPILGPSDPVQAATNPDSSTRVPSLPTSLVIAGTSISLDTSPVLISLPSGQITASYTANGLAINGQVFSLPAPNDSLSILTLGNGHVISVSNPSAPPNSSESRPGATIGAIIVEALAGPGRRLSDDSNGHVADGPSSEPFAAIQIDGHVIRLGESIVLSSGQVATYGSKGLVIGSQTVSSPSGAAGGLVTLANGNVVKVGNVPSVVVVDGVAIPVGQMVTIGGVKVSVGTYGVVIGPQTVGWKQRTVDVEGRIWSLGDRATVTATASGGEAKTLTGTGRGREKVESLTSTSAGLAAGTDAVGSATFSGAAAPLAERAIWPAIVLGVLKVLVI
ncbi:Indoleamine 2,3-dioxygenase 1 [Sphaceloma murrayae]|uniref:Indoleamine 2,3-dioxygenase 1 n=1 Tax=Sphaceloma murrayae TaxID=2082308 RepID=A0A2K1QJM0_9PEZI|nr:Indoleamine 2,3-dioxygenase 1 [Sphaceloma murrayae]